MRPLVEEALTRARALEDDYTLAGALAAKAELLVGGDADYQGAFATYEEAAAAYERAGDRTGAARMRTNLAEGLLLAGDHAASVSLLRHLAPEMRELGLRDVEFTRLRLLGLGLLCAGELEEAQGALTEAVGLTLELEDRKGTVDCLLALGAVAAERSELALAARVWAAAERELDASPYQLYPVDRLAYERSLASTRPQLADKAWDEAWAEGRRLSLEEAVAEAL
ncbi:MAG: hypothetical protein WKF65_09800 [Gaiellaceae bacterium]